jgi:hopanoid biosynthesis associated protein HpnK
LANAVNEAVEQAHKDGVLSAASLMVGGAAAADAVRRALDMPRLRVGLHLTLSDGWPVLPAKVIPDLVVRAGPSAGRLRSDLPSLGLAIVARPSVRSQIRSEIKAQFEAYRATGLMLDHVNAHRHYHLHPAILSEILTIGAGYGARALRTPVEPLSDLRRVEPTHRSPVAILIAPWAAAMRIRVRKAGWVSADRVFGLIWSGRMTENRIAGLIRNLSPGCTEVYAHPATSADFDSAAKGYAYAEELAALLSPRCREAVLESAATVGGYADALGAP